MKQIRLEANAKQYSKELFISGQSNSAKGNSDDASHQSFLCKQQHLRVFCSHSVRFSKLPVSCGGTLSLIHFSKEAIWLWAPSEQSLHHPNIKMAHIPPSAPRVPRLARPRAVCHTSSILYESGVDISPPGETDGTFHHTSKQLLKPVRQNTAENRRV